MKDSDKDRRSRKKIEFEIGAPEWLFRFLGYLKENPGAGFIIAFQALLIYAAVLLAIGNSSLANEMAVRAYYALVIGVVWMLIDYLREGRKAAISKRARS